MFNKILVPLDLSVLAEEAFGEAASIARATHAAIDLVVVHEPSRFPGYFGSPWSDADFASELKYVQSMAADLSAGTTLPVTSAVMRGAPAEMIERRAVEVGADLIVMTTHGRTGLSRAWLGSVADALVRHSRLPVLMLRPTGTSKARLASRHAFKHVLVPLDGSSLASNILPTATELAHALGAKVTLLRIVEPIPVLAPYELGAAYLPLVPDEAATERAADDARYELNEIAHRLSVAAQTTTEARVVVETSAARGITEFARTNDVDLIAMSTHGRGASRWLLGSVADKVLRASGCAMLLRKSIEAPEQERAEWAIDDTIPALSGL